MLHHAAFDACEHRPMARRLAEFVNGTIEDVTAVVKQVHAAVEIELSFDMGRFRLGTHKARCRALRLVRTPPPSCVRSARLFPPSREARHACGLQVHDACLVVKLVVRQWLCVSAHRLPSSRGAPGFVDV